MLELSQQHLDVIEQLLTSAKQHHATADVSISLDEGFNVDVRGGEVDTLEHQTGVALAFSLYKDQRVAHISATDITTDSAHLYFDKALSIVKYAEQDACSGLAPAALMAFDAPDLELAQAWSVTPTEAIEQAIACESMALAADKRIDQAEAVCVSHYNACHAYANTHGLLLSYPTTMHSMHCSLIAKDANGMQRDSEYTRSRRLNELHSLDWLAKCAVHKAVSRLDARQIATGVYPVILDGGVAKSLVGHFLSAISGGQLYQKSSFLCDKLGENLFPESVTISQYPHLLGAVGSVAFDDDGVKTRDLDYVTNGCLTSYALSHYSAQRLGMVTTGNAGGVHNCILTMPTLGRDALLKELGTGLVITDVMGQGVNIVTGDYSRGASGFWVENGQIQHAVEEITIASTLQQMFKGLVAMSDEEDTRSGIRCGSLLIDQMQVAGS